MFRHAICTRRMKLPWAQGCFPLVEGSRSPQVHRMSDQGHLVLMAIGTGGWQGEPTAKSPRLTGRRSFSDKLERLQLPLPRAARTGP